MVSWIVIGAMILFLYLFLQFRKSEHFKTKLYAVVIVLLLLFVYISGASIVEKNKLNLATSDGISSFVKLYFSWLGNAFENTKSLTGNAVKMDWNGNSTGG